MKKSLLELYALVVCLGTLTWFVVGLGIGIYDLIVIVNPEFTLNEYEFKRHQTNQRYYEASRIRGSREERPRPHDDQLTAMRQDSYAVALRSEQRSHTQSLTQISISMVIAAGVFLLHWRLALRARSQSVVA